MAEKEQVFTNSFDEILGKDIVDKLLEKTGTQLTKEQIKKLEKEAAGSVDFMQAIEKIEIPKDNYVIFTDGDEQLLYENGEFYVISTIDSPIRRKKKTKKEATDMYLNYFIKYSLNPILDTKDKAKEVTKTKTRAPRKTKAPQKQEVVKKVEEKVEEKVQVKETHKSVDKEIEL